MLRFALVFLTLAAVVGCGESPIHHRRDRDRWEHDRRDHRRHYRMASDDEPDDSTETPMPPAKAISDEPPKPAVPDKSDEMLSVLKSINSKLDDQPKAIHHALEQFEAKITAPPPMPKIMPIPQAKPPKPANEAEPTPFVESKPDESPAIREPEEASERRSRYTGIKIIISRDCPPGEKAIRDVRRECERNPEWTIGRSQRNHFWIVDGQKPCPRFEVWENGRKVDGWTGYDGNVDEIFERHPKFPRRNRDDRRRRSEDDWFPPKAPPAMTDADDYNDWLNDQGRRPQPPQSDCSRPKFAANCSQPSGYSSPFYSEIPSSFPVQSMPLPQQFSGYGGRQICGPNGCYWVP